VEVELTVSPHAIHEPTERHEEQTVPWTMLERVLELAASVAVLYVKEPRHPELGKQIDDTTRTNG
jgi:hypothetical protein